MFLDIVINTIDEYGMIKKDDCVLPLRFQAVLTVFVCSLF